MTDEKLPDDKKIYTEDSENKEIDTKEVLDDLYHRWLGEKVINSVWVRDTTLKRLMNEQGASLLISEIVPRFNTHSHFSVLDQQDIREIVSDTGTNLAGILKYDYWKYEIEPKHITDICDQITHALYIFLNISLGGGFRTYKGEKTKTIINKVDAPGEQSQ